ncbi:MAG: PAS domain-containing protein [Candidatus Cloacimonetes bacterium]|nr:PAS domain-containing protein [Candidatus Cloacimonadota bacterium]
MKLSDYLESRRLPKSFALISVLSSGILGICLFIFIYLERVQSVEAELLHLATYVAEECQNAVRTLRPAECQKRMDSLFFRDSLAMGVVYDATRQPFASYINRQAAFRLEVPRFPAEGHFLKGNGKTHVLYPLIFGGDYLGVVYFQENTAVILDDLFNKALFILLGVLLIGLMGYVVGVWLSRLWLFPVARILQDAEGMVSGEIDIRNWSLPEPSPRVTKLELALIKIIDLARHRFMRHMNELERAEGIIQVLESENRERKRTETELWATQQYLYNLVNKIPSLIAAVDADLRVRLWNREAENATGVTVHNAMGKPLRDVLKQFQAYYKDVRESMDTSQPVLRDRSLCIVDGVIGAVIKIDDVTERVQFYEMMTRSEKMISVGALAAGMAHEINNPLAGILQSSQVLRDRLSDGLEANEEVARELNIDLQSVLSYARKRQVFQLLDAIQEAGKRASQIIRRMLGFSRTSNSRYTRVNLIHLVEETLKIAENDINLKKRFRSDNLIIEKNFADHLPEIDCDFTQIQQVLLNLVKNSVESMAEQKEPRLILDLKTQNQSVVLAVEDNGHGMTEDVVRRVFEPFFTTKNPGEGTGLGLPVSYFIIKEGHGGEISVRSVPNHWTRFEILLPIQQKAPRLNATGG